MTPEINIIIPTKNEELGLLKILPQLMKEYASSKIIVVDDGSSDQSAKIAKQYSVTLLQHPYSKGNGACIKTALPHLTHDITVILDADGQHQVADIAKILAVYQKGYDMVVATRNKAAQASFVRWLGNSFGNWLASYLVNHPVKDLTSGFRAISTSLLKNCFHLLPNGFSVPTTLTMAFFRSGYSVAYVDANVQKRLGKSHLNPFRESLRFLLILYKMTTLYSPLKIFVPLSVLFFAFGISNYIYTFLTIGRFTNMSAVLLTTSIIILLIGLVSEQITTLLYMQQHKTSEKLAKPEKSVDNSIPKDGSR